MFTRYIQHTLHPLLGIRFPLSRRTYMLVADQLESRFKSVRH